MDWNIVEGNCKQFKGKVKKHRGKLTDDHLAVIAGNRDQLAGKNRCRSAWSPWYGAGRCRPIVMGQK